jgi:hypothetical protein
MSNTVITPKVLPPPFSNNNFSVTPIPHSTHPVHPKPLARPPPLDISSLNHEFFTNNSPYYNNEEIESSIIINIDESIKYRMCNYEKTHIIATKSAIEMHNQNCDIHPEFLEFNYNLALFVATCIHFYPCKTIEEIASIIHRKWLIMSPLAHGGPLNIPYVSLPEIEKEKNRNIFRIVSKFV